MAPAYRDFYVSLIGQGYFLVMLAMLMLGMMQGNWLDTSKQHVMCFRKPRVLRLGTGMFSLFMLAIALCFALVAARDFGVWVTWLWNVPLSVLMAIFMAYFAGPQDVYIDLDARTCQVTKGWMFRPKRQTYPLTAASYMGICPGGQTYYVLLMIGDSTNKRFLLARPERKSDATRVAQEIADKLHLPIKETTLPGMRKLG